jgi:signal transduction histidine kinase
MQIAPLPDHEPERLLALKVVRDCGRNRLGMLNDILDYAKLSGGKVELERIAFSPAELLDGARRMFAPLAAAKGLILEFATAGLPRRLAGCRKRA